MSELRTLSEAEVRRIMLCRVRKKPVVVDAMRVFIDAHPRNAELSRMVAARHNQRIADWINEDRNYTMPANVAGGDVWVPSRLFVGAWAGPGDWVIKTEAGDCCPVPNHVFEAEYEPAGGAQ